MVEIKQEYFDRLLELANDLKHFAIEQNLNQDLNPNGMFVSKAIYLTGFILSLSLEDNRALGQSIRTRNKR